MDKKDYSKLFIKYLSGECSHDEKKQVEKLIKKDPVIKQNFEKFNMIWNTFDRYDINRDPGFLDDIESEWEQFQSRMQVLDARSKTARDKHGRSHYRASHSKGYSQIQQLLKVAALLMIAFGGGIFVTRMFYNIDETNNATDLSHFREVSTRTSQLADLVLMDGSRVNLNVKSTLRTYDTYNQDSRRIQLKGQGYFDVVADPSRPFIVETPHALITVVGTDFTVRAYPDEEQVQVMVASGSVFVESLKDGDRQSARVEAGYSAILNVNNGALQIKKAEKEKFMGWMEGKIFFEETPLPEVIKELERWFAVDFQMMDERLHDRRLTAVLDSRSLNNVLDVIGYVLGINCELKEGRVVQISYRK